MSDTAARAVSLAADDGGVGEEHILSTHSRPFAPGIPASARRQTPRYSSPSPDALWSRMAVSDAPNQGDASMVGVSMGREQTHMASPTTPAAEKSAAFDRMNTFGFFDATADDVEQLAGIKEDDDEASQNASNGDALGMPSPWVSGPQIHVDTVKEKNRSRTGSLFNVSMPSLPDLPNLPNMPSLPDLNMKQRWNNFNVPSLAEALDKITPNNASKGSASPTKRQSRANSLFANRMTWGPATRKDGSSSPRKASASNSRGARLTPTLPSDGFDAASAPSLLLPRRDSPPDSSAVSSMTTLSPKSGLSGTATPTEPTRAPALQTDGPQEDADTIPIQTTHPIRPRPKLRRSASDTSVLSRASTVYSFDADPDRFSHIDNMVNSRMKAVKDSWQDSALRHIASGPRRLSLKPSFLGGSEDGSSIHSRALSSIFSDDKSTGSRTRSLTPPDRAGSPKLSRHPTLDKSLDTMTGDLVMMGGYRGSILRSAEDGRQLWVPFKVGINVRKVNLEVGLDPEDEETEHTRIYSSGILSHIGPIDISRRLIRRIKASRNVNAGKLRFHDYGYDWRLSPELLGRRLLEFVEKLECNQPHTPPEQRGATVIAHSLGGLVTRWAVNQRPELFAGVIYAGTPQHCVNILGPLRNGDDVLLSSRVLTAQVNFTLRTSYALLPESGRCFIDKETKEEYPLNFFDASVWDENHLSPVLRPSLPPLPEHGRERKGSLLTRLRDSTLSLPLNGQSATDLAEEARSDSPPTSNKAQSSSLSPVRAAKDAAERKASDLHHPHQSTVQPTMSHIPVSGPATAVTLPKDRALAYLRRTLADTLCFKQALAHNPCHQERNVYPPHSVLYATCVPTVYGAQVSGRDGIKRADAYDNLVFAAGDGVVLARASMLPKGYRCAEGGRILTNRGHVGLLGDLESVGRCLMAVTGARRNGIGLGPKMEAEGS